MKVAISGFSPKEVHPKILGEQLLPLLPQRRPPCLKPGDPSYLGTPHTWGPLVHGDSSHLGTSHTWGPLILWDPSHLGTSYTWGPLIPGDLSYLGTSHSRLSLIDVWVIKFQTF